ncbi:phage tail protein [Proteus mirabilis]|nr:phage tail protein [Proteus mirabilis]
MGLRDIISYPFGYSSGFVDYKTLFGGTSTRAVGLVNFRNWGDKSGHGSCFQLMSIGGDGVDGYTGLYCRQGITGSEQYPEAIPSVFKLLDNRQVEGVDNAMLNNTNMPTMFFRQGGGAGTSDWFSGWGSGINLKYDWNNSVKIFFHGSSGVPTIATKRGSDIWWNVLLGSANTTVDSNGFVKKASPIININPDGTFTTNDESEGATVTRVAQGEYLIEGVLGFNSDAGWGGVDGGIEIPLDVNKQPLIWVDSEVMGDGSILVRTYHRTHPNAPKFARNDIDDYKDGDPIDIPDGRFISVRVQMPEQSIYNVRMREMEEAQKAEEERRKKEEGENQDNISNIYSD